MVWLQWNFIIFSKQIESLTSPLGIWPHLDGPVSVRVWVYLCMCVRVCSALLACKHYHGQRFLIRDLAAGNDAGQSEFQKRFKPVLLAYF